MEYSSVPPKPFQKLLFFHRLSGVHRRAAAQSGWILVGLVARVYPLVAYLLYYAHSLFAKRESSWYC